MPIESINGEIEKKLVEFVNGNLPTSKSELGIVSVEENATCIYSNLNLFDVFGSIIDKNYVKANKVFSCDVDRFLRMFKLDRSIIDFMDKFFSFGTKPVFAGGKLVDLLMGKTLETSDSDFDFFFTSEQDRLKLEYHLNADAIGNVKETANFKHVSEFDFEGQKLQLIKKEYAFIEEILENFDIRACAVAYFCGRIYWVKGALKDIKERKMNFLSVRKETYTSYLRVLKYNKKGFTISTGNMLLASVQLLQYILDNRWVRNDKLFDGNYHPTREEIVDVSYEEMLVAATQGNANFRLPTAINEELDF